MANLKTIFLAVAAIVASSATTAYATPTFTKGGTVVSGQGMVSSVAGATTIDFNSGSAPTSGPVIYSGGAVFTTSSSIAAQPPGDNSDFFSVGKTPSEPSPATLLFSSDLSYFGFYMGSPDTYNSVLFYSDGQLIDTLTGAEIAALTPAIPANGNQSVGFYVNAFASAGQLFDEIQFVSSSNAFETDNHAYVVAAVPEPASLALLGLGLIGFATARRRKS